MFRLLGTIIQHLFPVHQPILAVAVVRQSSGMDVFRERWFRKPGVLWFNGYPGVPKLPLVQRRRAAPSSLNPVAPFTPEDDEIVEEDEDDP